MTVSVISETIQEFNGVRYYLCDRYFQKDGRRLHVEVWEFYNGPTPAGYHVHHKDEDRTNNQLSNLEALPGEEHISLHMSQPDRVQKSREDIKKARDAARVWHGSEDGRAWHSKHWHESLAPLREEMVDLTCPQCGKAYQVPRLWAQNSKFCSNNCKSANRRALGLDNVQRDCPACGRKFTVNKYAKTKTCGKECALAMRSQRRSSASKQPPTKTSTT